MRNSKKTVKIIFLSVTFIILVTILYRFCIYGFFFPYENTIKDVENNIGWEKLQRISQKILNSKSDRGFLSKDDPDYGFLSKNGLSIPIVIRDLKNKDNDYLFFKISRDPPQGIVAGRPGSIPRYYTYNRYELGWQGSGIWGLTIKDRKPKLRYLTGRTTPPEAPEVPLLPSTLPKATKAP